MLLCSSAMRVSSSSSGLSSTSRMIFGMHVSGSGGCRQGKEEGGAAARLAVGPDRAAVPRDHAVHVGQADAGALEFCRRMQALKYAEQLAGVIHVETHTVVAYEISVRAIVQGAAELDPRVRFLAAELGGV